MKTENKWKRKGNKVLLALEEKSLAKISKENDKKNCFDSLTDRREREKCFEKVWKWQNTWKLKVLKNSLCDFRLIENKIWSIENYIRLIQKQLSSDRNGQVQTKILIAFSIGRATGSIDRKFGKYNFLKNKAILCRNSSKHSILWIKCMSMRWNAL